MIYIVRQYAITTGSKPTLEQNRKYKILNISSRALISQKEVD